MGSDAQLASHVELASRPLQRLRGLLGRSGLAEGSGLLLERSSIGAHLGLGRGIAGRVYCALFVVGPVFMLFHVPFVRLAILPTLAALGTY